ncbi:hypothetical protein HPG69_019286 [Diceros bicornis minor]|uniref:Small ribosomal subunit protein RACK1 n=1 Tax=Diceros bicornis minor TaxID=77932 RepID=A0A7J7FMI2_DICBM|nr:hypothetical protein HPG69_019286 [Diceros bicornis minor]
MTEQMTLCGILKGHNGWIVSGSQDKTIKLWNTLGVCKYAVQDESHSEWVSCVHFSPNSSNPIIVSWGWNTLVKAENWANCKLKTNLIAHMGYLNTVAVSPDDPPVLLEARMTRPSCGTSMKTSTFIC